MFAERVLYVISPAGLAVIDVTSRGLPLFVSGYFSNLCASTRRCPPLEPIYVRVVRLARNFSD